MPLTTVQTSEVKFLQILDEKGKADGSLMFELPEGLIKRFFEAIILARAFNNRALSLQREGRLGTYASIHGQEASQIGSALAFEKEDWVFPSFRETAVHIALGYPLWMLFRYWAGDERGVKSPEGLNIFPMSVPVGTHIPHATGAAMAMKLKGRKAASAVYFGDGGSSRGDFHEGINLAGVFKAPCLFLCQNNQWAISVPRARQSAAITIAGRAMGYGIEGIQVDGNDVFAVYKATRDALDRARKGQGPTLIECVTYRLDDHTTSDDSSRYRSKEEVEAWQKKEPLIRLRLYMEKSGLWTKEYEETVIKDAQAKVDKAIEEEESFPKPKPSDMIRYGYKEPCSRQIKEMKDFGWQD